MTFYEYLQKLHPMQEFCDAHGLKHRIVHRGSPYYGVSACFEVYWQGAWRVIGREKAAGREHTPRLWDEPSEIRIRFECGEV